MASIYIAYLAIAALIIMAVLMVIDILIRRFMPIGCVFLFLGFMLAVFVYTLNH